MAMQSPAGRTLAPQWLTRAAPWWRA